MKVLKYLAIGLILLIAAAFVGSFFLSDKAHAERSIVIDRPPSVVFALLNSFQRFNEWSPWADLDPKTQYEYSGTERGVGAKMAWTSTDPSVGSGKQEITASKPNERVETLLDFGDQGKANAYFQLTPEGKGTRVAWGFNSDLNGPIERLFGLIIPGMIGGDYEKGLAKLKPLAESLPNVDLTGVEAELTTEVATPAYAVAAEAGVDEASSTEVLTAAYGEIMAFMAANQINQSGPVFTRILSHADGKWRFEASIPVDRNDVAGTGRIQATQSFGGKAIRFKHLGSYDSLSKTHEQAHGWLAVNKLTEIGTRYEVYVSDPATTPVDELLTQILVPIE
ncbi:MAG: SRPBCC family protein [Ahniella sp.]|nr:SRPBCC family protein [Ahniella sp.]